jgi:hypothetical protein
MPVGNVPAAAADLQRTSKANMGENQKLFISLARGLLRDRPDLGRRYLALCRRRRVLRRGVREAHLRAIHENPLADVNFRAPLSVAGCSSLTVVRAEGLALEGVPVAFELDARGRHRGTPLGVLLGRLNRVARLGNLEAVTEEEALRLYRAYMAASPRLLPRHPLRRYAQLPALLERVRRQMEAVQEGMLAVYAARDPGPSLEAAVTASMTLGTSRFMVFADRESLSEALAAAALGEAIDSSGVVVAYSARAGLRINKRPVATAWGRGEGMAVLRIDDLASLLGTEDGPVGIECLPETWRGWPAGRNQYAPGKSFRYYDAPPAD